MKTALALCLIAGTTLSVKAEEAVKRPAGCALVATVQDDHCAVQNYFKCSGTGTAAYRKEVRYGGGEVEVHTFNADHGGLEIIQPAGGAHIEIRSDGAHPSTIMAAGSGRVTDRATITRDGKSRKAMMEADYLYNGESRELAGEKFDRLTYSTTISYVGVDGKLHTSGSVLFNERLDLLIDELEVSDGQGKPGRKVKLKSLTLEGQKGFGATKPKFGCN